MCGIYAIHEPTGLRGETAEHLEALGTLAHRGPDDEGHYRDATTFIGHRRLAILDLSPAGRQPMLGANGQVVIAFNGQIYNHPELRLALEARGHRFRSTCDTETLLAAYLEYGSDVFARLRGMWAVVIWDRRDGSLIACRDRFGIKPLYFHRYPQGIAFASEIKTLLHVFPATRRADGMSLRRYVTRGWIDHTAQTMFDAIESIEPATMRIWRDGRDSIGRRYWAPPRPTESGTDVAEIRDRFIDAVRCHLQSDAPVATTLSGGLDSTSIACVVARTLGHADSVKAFTVTPPDTADERPWIEDSLDWTGIEHAYHDPGTVDMVAALDAMIEQMDEPVFNAAYVFQEMLRREIARLGYKVVLVGDGGDEVFAGYAKLIPMYVLSLLESGRGAAARAAIRGATELTGTSPSRQIERLRALRDRGVGARTMQEFRRGYDLFSADTELGDEALFPEVEHPQLEGVVHGRRLFRELLDRLRIDVPHHLRNEDRNSMAHGLEARPVFLDHELLETAWTFPFHRFMEGGTNKRLLRDAMSGTVTPSVLELRKKYVRPGNNSLLSYDLLREPIREAVRAPAASGDTAWSESLAQLYEDDLRSRSVDNAYPWFRFYLVQRWLQLKMAPGRESGLMVA